MFLDAGTAAFGAKVQSKLGPVRVAEEAPVTKGILPDEATVVRGGVPTAEQI
ncbi:MAG TPA: hypothetical protein VGO47_06475 [Chlamydiales bacterium]|nr:hypothetical protein [Chlamydiales bacterium]